MNQAEQKARIIALEQQVAAIAGMANRAARETEARLERLETAVLDFHDRIEKLEAALEPWLIAVDWPDAATPPMSEMVVPAP